MLDTASYIPWHLKQRRLCWSCYVLESGTFFSHLAWPDHVKYIAAVLCLMSVAPLVVCSVSFVIDSLTCPSYPTYTSVLLRAIEWWYHDPNVSTPVLKLMAELVQNRSQRLHFDVSSPNGILLFRVTSEMIVAYGMKVNYWIAQVMIFHSGSVLFTMQHYQDDERREGNFVSKSNQTPENAGTVVIQCAFVQVQ